MNLARQRLDSLDVFRGFTVAAMILVSTPGTWTAVYWPLDHALWNGWTPTDLVFPFFLFAVGAAVPLALARRRSTGDTFWRHAIRRAAILVALGLVLNAMEMPAPMRLAAFRVAGVLQRIAIVYLAVVFVTATCSRRAQAGVAAVLLVGYWALLVLVPVPGFGAGVLSPDGNLASYIDRAVLPGHLLHPEYDPEGLLSTVPSVATALCGVFAGEWLMEAPDSGASNVAGVLWAAGALATVAGLLWGRTLPLNKNLWTSSFALFTAGLAAQVLAACHWIVTAPRWRRLTMPFAAFGRNALAAYFLSVGLDSLLSRWSVQNAPSMKSAIFRAGFASWIRPCCGNEAASLAYAVAYVCVWAVVVSYLHRRRIFLSL
jgi:predicted acyltransferase